MKLLFSYPLENIISGLPSPRKVVILNQSPQSLESPIPEAPPQYQRAPREESVYTSPAPSRARVNSTLTQQPLSSPRLSHLSSWSGILSETLTHTAHWNHEEKMHFGRGICF